MESQASLAQEPINWSELSDEVLPAPVRAEFERLGLPEVMTVVEITSYAHQVMESLAETPEEHVPAGKVVPLRPAPDVDDATGIPQI